MGEMSSSVFLGLQCVKRRKKVRKKARRLYEQQEDLNSIDFKKTRSIPVRFLFKK
jgi:hypothetical protein